VFSCAGGRIAQLRTVAYTGHVTKQSSDEPDFEKQMAVARSVMARRNRALGELAGKINAAEEIMQQDRDILRRLAD
jgi:hypothetical protein